MTPRDRALVLAPHTDDGEFGCGGTIAKLAQDEVLVYYVALSIPEPVEELGREVHEATKLLGVERLDLHRFTPRDFYSQRQEILQLFVELGEELQPTVVFCPSSSDVHQDHQVVAAEAQRAFKRTTLLGYELPWNNYRFSYQAFVGLSFDHVELKTRAIACYRSQEQRAYADAGYLRAQARVHGVAAGTGWAEAFEVYRAVL